MEYSDVRDCHQMSRLSPQGLGSQDTIDQGLEVEVCQENPEIVLASWDTAEQLGHLMAILDMSGGIAPAQRMP